MSLSEPTKPNLPNVFPMPYDDNITLMRYATKPHESLKENEFYVLMVTDPHERYFPTVKPRAKSDFFKPEYYWVGLECVYNNKVYISKRYNKRHNFYRGVTMIASVKDSNRCFNLD